jgi:hypothetical protein
MRGVAEPPSSKSGRFAWANLIFWEVLPML